MTGMVEEGKVGSAGRRRVSIEQGAELFPLRAAVPEDLPHPPGIDGFARVDGTLGRATLCVTQEVMATARSHHGEPAPLERSWNPGPLLSSRSMTTLNSRLMVTPPDRHERHY